MAFFDFDDVSLDVPDALLDKKLTQKMSSKDYEGPEARAVRMRVQKDHRVLELGGGVGYISSICAQITAPQNVTTVEANPKTVDVIRQNLDRNGASAARVIHGAVIGDSIGSDHLLFRVGRVFWGSSIADDTASPEDVVEVPTLLLADLFETYKPHVVIMDIEGAEQSLFDQPWPRFVRHVIVELHPRKYAPSVIKKIVDCMSQTNLTYDPGCSTGALLAFRRA